MSRENSEHWYDHAAAPMVDMCLAKDLIQASEPPLKNPLGDELVLICGNCGHHCHAYHSEYTGDSDSLRETYCPNCLTACFRQTLVVASYHFADELSKEKIHRYLLNRADELAWSGGVGHLDVPGAAHKVEDSPVPDEALQTVLSDCGVDWENTCPACGRGRAEDDLDFHHWDYDTDTGCQLCRTCHNEVHNGMSASEQTEATGRAWQFEAVERLLQISNQNGLAFDDAESFKQRYNVPKGTLAEDAVSESFEQQSRGESR